MRGSAGAFVLLIGCGLLIACGVVFLANHIVSKKAAEPFAALIKSRVESPLNQSSNDSWFKEAREKLTEGKSILVPLPDSTVFADYSPWFDCCKNAKGIFRLPLGKLPGKPKPEQLELAMELCYRINKIAKFESDIHRAFEESERARFALEALKNHPYPPLQTFDLSTVKGQQDREDYERRLPLLMEATRAQRKLEVAKRSSKRSIEMVKFSKEALEFAAKVEDYQKKLKWSDDKYLQWEAPILSDMLNRLGIKR